MTTKRDQDGGGYVTLVICPCTFCGGKLSLVVKAEERDNPDALPAMLHVEPACHTFLEADLVDFMQANRERLGIDLPPEEVVN